jgi:hypothetical protein
MAEYVANVDRLLTRAHELYSPAGDVAVGGGGGGGSVPAPPAGDSALRTGAGAAGGVYEQTQSGLAGLDAASGQAAAEGGAIAAQGSADSGAIRDAARTQAAAIAPLANSPAGMRLLVATMDQQVAAMQGHLETTTAHNQALATRLQQVAAGYRRFTNLAGTGKESPPTTPLDSQTWKPGDKRHQPYIAGRGGMGPPNLPGVPPWIEIGSGSGVFVRSDELPGVKVLTPGSPGPTDVVGPNSVPYIQLGPQSGVWVPKSDFPGAVILPQGSSELPPYGYDEYLPGSGIFVWHGDLVPEPYNPRGPLGPPTQTFPSGH